MNFAGLTLLHSHFVVVGNDSIHIRIAQSHFPINDRSLDITNGLRN